MPNTITARGIILQLIPYGESDLIGSLLCEGVGKLRVIAKGARKSKRRFMGGLDIFDCGTFELNSTTPDADLHFVHGVSNRRAWRGLRSDLNVLSISSLLLEATDRLLMEGDSHHADLFPALCSALELLDEKHKSDVALRYAARYLVALLTHCGFHPAEDISHFDTNMREGFRNIHATDQGGPPIAQLVLALIDYIERHTSKKLRTKDLLTSALNCRD